MPCIKEGKTERNKFSLWVKAGRKSNFQVSEVPIGEIS